MWRISLLTLFFLSLTGQSPGSQVSDVVPVRVSLSSLAKEIHPGETIVLDVELELDEGWHVYYKIPGDVGKPTTVELTLPPGFTVSDLRWPTPESFEDSGFTSAGYVKKVTLSATITAPPDAVAGANLEVSAKVSWLACKGSCVPGSATLKLSLPIAAGAVANAPVPQVFSLFAVLYAMATGFCGGMLLNLMPCVLPVVSLKIMSFAKQAGQDRKRIFQLGLGYAAGTLSTFLLMALVVIALQQLGVAVGWGFQFQQPLFVLVMASVVALMTVSMFGVFDISVNSGVQGLDGLTKQEGLRGAFFTGVLATLLSTPCTAPFLGTALGFAFTQPWLVIIMIFLSIGMGLSAPYLALTYNPAWLKMMPKPGMWMVRLKEAMGFAMLLTLVWLVSVLVSQCGPAAVLPTCLWLVTLVVCGWLYGAFAPPHASVFQRRSVMALIAAVALLSGWCFLPSLTTARKQTGLHVSALGVTTEEFSEEALKRHLAAGRVVVLDFTADWCLTCQVFEKTVLSSSEVQQALVANNAVVLRCDWTNGDPLITAKLREFGRSGVPVYVVYSPHRTNSPQLLPEVLTRSAVVEALVQARQP